MTTKHLNAAFDSDIDDPGRRFVFVVLCDSVDANGTWILEAEEIARRTAMGVSTVRRHLTWLMNNGYVEGQRLRRSAGRLGGYRWTLRPVEDWGTPVLKSSAGEKCAKAVLHKAETAVSPVLKSSSGATAQIEQSPVLDLSSHIPTQETHPTSEADASETGARAQAPTFSDFERFWGAYPNRTGRGRARRFWGGLVKAGTLPAMDVLLAAVQRYASGKPADRQWLTPATWLADEHWLDDPPPDDGPGLRRSSPSSSSTAMPPITVPEDLHAAVAEACGAAFAASYLSGAEQVGFVVVPKTSMAFDRLRRERAFMRLLAQRNLGLSDPRVVQPQAVR